MAGERDTTAPTPSDDDNNPSSSSEGNQAERQSAANDNQQRNQDQGVNQRGEVGQAENQNQSPDAVSVPPGLLEPLRNEVIRRLSKEDIDKAIQTGQYNTPELRQLRELQNAIQRASQEKEESQLRLSEFNQQLAVRRTIGLVDVFHTEYNVAIHNAERRGLTFAQALEEGKKAVRELVERQLAAIEEDDTGVRSEDVAALQQAINITIVDDLFRAELTRKAVARSFLHYGAFTSKYIGGEEWAKVPTNFVGMHVREILETTGVKEAIDLLEKKDDYGSAGEYYRMPQAELKEDDSLVKNLIDYETKLAGKPLTKDQLKDLKESVWLVNRRFELIEKERADKTKKTEEKIRNIDQFTDTDSDLILKIGIYKMSKLDPKLNKQYTPKMAVIEILEKFPELANKVGIVGDDDEHKTRRERLIELLYDTNRAFELGIRLHHMTGQSAVYDGPRWKTGTKIPPGYTNAGQIAGENQLVELNPIIEWPDPEDGWKGDPNDPGRPKVKLNLRTADEQAKDENTEEGKKIKRTLEHLRSDPDKGRRYSMSIAWTLAWQKFYRENWNNIDFEHSAKSTRAARMANRILNFPVILEHSTEVHPGRAKYLRRFTPLAVPSLMQMSSYSSVRELVEGWNGQFTLMKEGWVPRLASSEKLKGQINRKDPDIINSTKNLREFVKSLSEMKPTMKEYMTPTEVGASVENWLRGLLEFRALHSEDVDLLNLNKEGLKYEIHHARIEGLIGEHRAENIERDLFAPKWLHKIGEYKPFSHDHFPGKLIWGIGEGWEKIKDSVKGLWWTQGLVAFVKELLKQIATPSKQ